MSNEFLCNGRLLKVGEPRRDPPLERNPVRLSPVHCSYEVLRDHLLDEAIGGQDPEGPQKDVVRSALLFIYGVMGVREITLTREEEDEWRKP